MSFGDPIWGNLIRHRDAKFFPTAIRYSVVSVQFCIDLAPSLPCTNFHWLAVNHMMFLPRYMNKDNCKLFLWYPLLWNMDVIFCNLHHHPARAISTIEFKVKLNQVKGAQTGLLISKTNFSQKKERNIRKC